MNINQNFQVKFGNGKNLHFQISQLNLRKM